VQLVEELDAALRDVPEVGSPVLSAFGTPEPERQDP
jgi:hypothetical protein